MGGQALISLPPLPEDGAALQVALEDLCSLFFLPCYIPTSDGAALPEGMEKATEPASGSLSPFSGRPSGDGTCVVISCV